MEKPNNHFPVNTLISDSVGYFNNLCDVYLSKYCLDNGLYNKIRVEISDNAIDTTAEIVPHFDNDNNKYYQIVLYDNYCQFLWILCYSSIVFTDELVLKPILKTPNVASEAEIQQAIDMFKSAMDLFNTDDSIRPNRSVFFDYPNPLTKSDCHYVSTTNALFIPSLLFVLSHELGHFNLGHYDKTPAKNEEFDADYEALYNICITQGEDIKSYTSLGAIIALQSIIFCDNTLKGGDSHPDPTERILKLFDKMNGCIDAKSEEYCHIMAVTMYKLWAYVYGFKDIVDNVNKGKSFSEYFKNINKEFTKFSSKM